MQMDDDEIYNFTKQPVVLTREPYIQQTSGAIYRECLQHTFERDGTKHTLSVEI